MRSINKYHLSAISLLFYLSGYTQVPFSCDGDLYTVAGQSSSSSILYDITFNDVTQAAVFNPLSTTNGYTVNSIGYRVTDNLIYGIDYLNNVLYRFDANGLIENLGLLDLPDGFSYPAGDISPDGKSLVLIGLGPADSILISYINLENINYDVFNYEMSTSSGDPVFCTDIAFHPLNQQLFGFDVISRRLVTIDIDMQLINNVTFPVQDSIIGLPALFFDPFGSLFGIGKAVAPSSTNLYEINIETGEVDFFQMSQMLVMIEMAVLALTRLLCCNNSSIKHYFPAQKRL